MPETHREHEKRPEQGATPDAVYVAKIHKYYRLFRVVKRGTVVAGRR